MTQYLLTIYQPDGGPPPPEVLEPVGRDLHALNQELKAAGAWVFSARAARAEHGHGASGSATATSLITDGPYVEGKEHIGGFWIVDAPDLDAALGWARKAARATTLPIEVRPFQDVPEY